MNKYKYRETKKKKEKREKIYPTTCIGMNLFLLVSVYTFSVLDKVRIATIFELCVETSGLPVVVYVGILIIQSLPLTLLITL